MIIMNNQQQKQAASKSSPQAMELERTLKEVWLRKMLHGRAGSFTMRYLFINQYINFVNLIASNPSKISDRPGFWSLNDVINILKFIWRTASRKTVQHADVLLISRDRRVRVKTKSGYSEGDYVFHSVLDELKSAHPSLRAELYIIDDSYQKYEICGIMGIVKAVILTLEKTVLWLFIRKKEISNLIDHGYSNVARSADSYFRFRTMLRDVLLGNAIDRLIALNDPQVIVSNDDCLYTKPVGIDAEFIVLQSARMVEYGEECRSYIFKEPILLPDYFLASGHVFAEVKERFGVAKNVIVTGLPRYDILGIAGDVYSKSEFRERYGIDPDSKIVLWSTQCHVLSAKENVENFSAVFGAIRNLEGVTLVIKQHPAEGDDYRHEVERHIKEMGVKAVLMPKDSDTYEQLFACDLMITRHSTTAMEAVALGKPVIILNLSGDPDPVEYVEEGVALGIYESGELKLAIERLLRDDSELASNRKRYIENYLYKIDGKATERVIEIIIKAARDRRSRVA